MNLVITVLRSGCHLVWVCFSITTNIRKKTAEAEEEEHLVHSCGNALTFCSARVLSVQDIIFHPSALLKDRQAYAFSFEHKHSESVE